LLLLASGDTLVPGGYGWALIKVLLALGVICLAAYAIVRAARGRLGISGRPGDGPMRVIDRYPLSPRQALWLVGVGPRVFLIGAGEGGVRRLAEIDPADLDSLAGQGGGADVFDRLLDRARRGDPDGGAVDE